MSAGEGRTPGGRWSCGCCGCRAPGGVAASVSSAARSACGSSRGGMCTWVVDADRDAVFVDVDGAQAGAGEQELRELLGIQGSVADELREFVGGAEGGAERDVHDHVGAARGGRVEAAAAPGAAGPS